MTQQPHAQSRRPHAFTIIELVVAMAIASIMIFLINRIFFDTTNAVSKGMGLSQIIGESRAISSTLTTDFIPGNTIALPADEGFLFIGFRQYTNIEFPSPQRLGSQYLRDVTSDQLLLVMKNMTDRYPLTPEDDSTYSPYNASTSYGLLWYGHVARLNPDGTYAAGLGVDPNQFGHNWIVGRQLSFLGNNSTITGSGTVVHAVNPYATSPVANYGGLPAGVPQLRYMGLTDLIAMELPSSVASGLINTYLPALTSADDYISHVAAMAYVTQDASAFPVHRLRVATGVAQNVATPTDSFESWNVAQTHPAFMTNCSDFQISFAGDFDADGEIDTETTVGTYIGGGIKWYGFPVNDPSGSFDADKPALYSPLVGTTVFAGVNPGDPVYTVGGVTLSGKINAAPIPPATPTDNTLVDHAVVFRHDATTPATQWPHMIRIRYRLHDERGEIESTTGGTRTQGIWFEQIIRIQ